MLTCHDELSLEHKVLGQRTDVNTTDDIGT